MDWRDMPKVRAMQATGSFMRLRRQMSRICSVVSRGLRPLYLPLERAMAMPSRCRSRMNARSNSATAPMICKCSR